MTKPLGIDNARTSSISIIPGVRVGHVTHQEHATGCTAIVCESDAIAGVDVRGGATASHELSALDPCGLVERVQGIVLSGGSAPGLASVTGAVRYFQEHQRGFVTNQGVIPVVPAAAIFDRGIGNPQSFPSADDGYQACLNAKTNFARGSVGAGTGAVVGKVNGHSNATMGGLGTAGWETQDGLRVGALAVVNAFGDILNPDQGKLIAGARTDGGSPLNTIRHLIDANPEPIGFGTNTTLCVIATNARLTKTQATIVARIAQSGVSRAVSPCHTQFDGDMVFALSLGDHQADLNRIGVLAGRMIESAIIDAVWNASSAHGIPSVSDLGWVESSHGAGE